MTGDAAGETGPTRTAGGDAAEAGASRASHAAGASHADRTPRDVEVVLLRPARGSAIAWSVVGGVAAALSGWLVADTGGHPLAVVLLGACVAAAYPVLLAAVAPDRVAWRLDEQGLLVPRPWGSWSVGWEEVRLARVVRRFGEPALELTLVEAAGRPRTRRLPLGADVERLHAALASRLGPTPE